MKTRPNQKTNRLVAALIALALPLAATAANVTLKSSDNVNTTSYNTSTSWGPDSTGYPPLAPQPTNDYYTSTFFLRTPTGSGNFTFAGNSLTLQAPSGQNTPMRSILFKGSGGNVYTINNLTNAGGIINSGSGNVSAPTFTGNLMTVAANSTIEPDQGPFIIGYPIVGSANLTNCGSSGGVHTATYTGSLSGFTGKLIAANVNGGITVALNPGATAPGNPATLTPDQITIANGCTLQDSVGLAFTNANGGFTLSGGNGNINAGGVTVIGEPITDVTNGVHSISSLTLTGAGTVVLSNANNTYYGGTTISSGLLQLGLDNAIPGNAVPGDVTDNAQLDLNAHNATINGLNGSGTVDTSSGGTPTLTIGANGDSGTFSGTIQNSSGTLSVVKIGAGTETFSGGYTYSGATVIAGGALVFSGPTFVPSVPGSLIASNGAALTANVSGGTALAANNLIIATNSVLNLTLSPTATGVNANGLIFQDNATNNFTYAGALFGNPTAPVINVSGGVSAPGSNIVINIAATGLQPGTFTLIQYTGTPLASIANFNVSPPPGVAATLVNNTGNDSIDLNITSIPNQLSWNGVNGTSWDLVTANWLNTISSAITVFQQYTNGAVIAGDAVTFDDTLTNDFVNPQPTNIVLNSRFYAFPVTVNSTLPYSIAGAGGIVGVTSLVKSNAGSLTLLTSNSFTGGVSINGGTVIITNDFALGASSGSVTLNGGALQISGGVTNSRAFPMPSASVIGVAANDTVRLTGVISGAGALTGTNNGTLVLAAHETFGGNLFAQGGINIVIDSGGSIGNGGNFSSIGLNGTDNATLTIQGTGAFTNTADFNVGDIGNSTGTMNILNSGVVSIQNLFIGSANESSSTASGTVNMNGGTLIEKNTGVGSFVVGGRNSASSTGVGVLNLTNGYISAVCGIRVGDYGTGTINQYGGLLEVTNGGTGINLHRENTATSAGTYNLNGGTLRTEKVTTSIAGVNSLFYFNGGTLQAGSGSLGTTPFMNNLVHAYVRNGGAIIDDHGYTITISQALGHSTVGGDNATDGGLTKLGTGTLTLAGTNTYTGSTTVNGGTLILNAPSTYAGSLLINTGAVQIATTSTLQGSTVINNGALLTINQVGGTDVTLGNLTFNGTTTLPGATLSFSPTLANNPATPLLNCGTLTLNGTNTISLPLESVGTIALIKYTTLAGSGNCTNLALPQGAVGYVSNNVANSTLYAVITGTGPGIVWVGGTNSVASKTNLWDISTSTNWVLNATPTTYHQVVVPGDAVTFNDSGNGIVVLNTAVGPTSLTISNNTRTYTFSGTGGVTGPTGLLKLGSGTAVLGVTNDNYSGSTTISNGVLQVVNTGVGNVLPPAANLVIGPGGTLNLQATLDNPVTTVNELAGSGAIHQSGAHSGILAFGGSAGSTWNGSIYDDGNGQGLALTKNGAGTSIIAGSNNLDNGNAFSVSNIFIAGVTILTNNGALVDPTLQTFIGYGPGSTATMIVDGGALSVGSDILGVGYSTNSVGTLVVNNGTVSHGGGTTGHFGGENNIIVGTAGGVGTMIVNGGQVLNTQGLVLGEGATGSGTLYLNGGLVQATLVFQNNAPTNSVAYFNGGTLQAATNTADYLRVTSMVMSNGLILDDNGFTLSIGTSDSLQAGDAFNGGLVKKGSGTVYLDGANSYAGTTVVTNGTLAGVGSVSGPLIVAPAGDLGAGDAAGIGDFSIFNNLTLLGNVTMRIDKTGGSPSQDQVFVSGNVNYGGVLTITNTTSDSTALVSGDAFQLFNVSGTFTGNFSSIAGSPGAGLAYSYNPSNGILSVITQTIAPNSTNITAHVSGSSLTISWPSDHLGWILQAQTNSLGAGLSPAVGSWIDIAGSSNSVSENITIDPAKPSVFYRLRHP